MRVIFGTVILSISTIIASYSLTKASECEPASAKDTIETFGGACLDCRGPLVGPACKPGFLPACQQGAGFCVSYTFTSIATDFCMNVADGTGFKGCNTYTPKPCVRIKTCTGCAAAAPCTNCGVETTEDKSTECSIIPYARCAD
jgi:hypothetical protein